jgi:serine/threonine-protein kinase
VCSSDLPAWSGLADAWSLLAGLGADALAPREVMPKAKHAALEAVRLDDSLAEGHTSLGYILLSYDWDLEAAATQFRRAIELNPGYPTAHHWYAHYFLAAGKPDEALRAVRRAQLLDPSSSVVNTGVGWCLYHARRYIEAIEQYRSTLSVDPAFALAHSTLGMALQQSGRPAEALAEFKQAAALPGSAPFALAGLAAAMARSGQPAEARRLLDQLLETGKTRYVPAVYPAAVYASLGEKDRSIDWVRRAYDERSEYMVYLPSEPWADALRKDTRFRRLLELVRSGGRDAL